MNFKHIVALASLLFIAGCIQQQQSVVQDKPTYLIVTSQTQLQALQPLIDLRGTEYKVEIHTPTNPSSNLIKAHIASLSPTHVFIVGDTSVIPTFTTTDNPYADLDNDGYPEIAVGRLPLNDRTQISNYVSKIVYYENSNYYATNNAVFVGGSEGNSFRTCRTYQSEVFPTWSYPRQEICCKCYNEQTNCPTSLIDLNNAINSGTNYVVFKGHGGRASWVISCHHDRYFDTMEARNLNNQYKYPIAITMSCATATLKDEVGIPKEVLGAQDSGFVALVGSTETTGGYEIWAKNMFTHLQSKTTIGEAFVATKQGEPDYSNLIQQQHILGDPATHINSVGTPPPSRFVCDSNSNGIIDRTELGKAINKWSGG